MRAFVTGGTGFLGQRVVKQLLADGAEVACLVRATSNRQPLLNRLTAAEQKRLHFIEARIDRPEELIAHMRDYPVVYHIAAALGGGCSSLFLNTVVSTRSMIEAAQQAEATRFVMISSFGVYEAGEMKRGSLLNEDSPIDSQPHLRDPYTYSKIAQERVAWEAYHKQGLPLVIIRPGVIYGPGRGAISGRIGLSFAGRLLRIGGSRQLPYTYVENCALAVAKAGYAEGAIGQAINVIDDNLPTPAKVLKTYRKLGQRKKVWTIPGFAIGTLSRCYDWYHRYSKGQLPGVITPYKSRAQWKRLKYSNAKAHQLLEWNPPVKTEDAIKQSILGSEA